MKTVKLILLLVFTTFAIKGQDQEITLKNNQKFLLGQITQEKLSTTPYNSWFETNFDTYRVDAGDIAQLKKNLQGYKILIFLGTWCGDSKREVPRFLKILETTSFPKENIKLVALDGRKDTYKTSPNSYEFGLNILRVPTFIFYKNGKEINRIIESPNESLEKDILAITSDQDYTPKKARSYHFD